MGRFCYPLPAHELEKTTNHEAVAVIEWFLEPVANTGQSETAALYAYSYL